MKRFFTILAVVAAGMLTIAATTGCEADLDVGRDRGDGLGMSSFDLTVRGGDWIRYPETGPFEFYWYSFEDVDELSPSVLANGFYTTYHVWFDNNILVQESLPAVVYHEEPGGRLWEENLSCDYDAYHVTFYLSYSDFADREPGELNFRFVSVY